MLLSFTGRDIAPDGVSEQVLRGPEDKSQLPSLTGPSAITEQWQASED